MDRHQPNTADITTNATEAGVFKKIGNVLRRPEGKAIEAALVMGIGLSALTACAPEEAPKPTTTQSQETSEPGETTEPTPEGEWSPEISVEDVEIPAGLETEDLGKQVIKRINDWKNAGTDNPKIYQDWRNFNGETGDFVQSITQQYAPIYTEALFVSDWQSHEDLARAQDVYVRGNSYFLELNLITGNPENGDKEPFHRTITFNSARELSNDGTTRVIEVDYTETNNAALNRVGEEFGTEEEGNLGTNYGIYTFTLVNVDGVDKIASISAVNR